MRLCWLRQQPCGSLRRPRRDRGPYSLLEFSGTHLYRRRSAEGLEAAGRRVLTRGYGFGTEGIHDVEHSIRAKGQHSPFALRRSVGRPDGPERAVYERRGRPTYYITCPRPALYRCDCEARTIVCAAISNSALIARGMRLWYHLSERGARARGPRGVGRPKRDLSAQKCGFEQIEVDAQGVCAYNIGIEHVI